MLFTENETLVRVLILSLLVHCLPVTDQPLLNATPHVKSLRAIFVVTFNAATCVFVLPTYVAAKAKSAIVYYSINHGLRFITEPNLFYPVHTVVMDPSKLVVVHHYSLKIVAKVADSRCGVIFMWAEEEGASFAIPVRLRWGHTIQNVMAIARLMDCRVAEITHHEIVVLRHMIIDTDVALNQFIWVIGLVP